MQMSWLTSLKQLYANHAFCTLIHQYMHSNSAPNESIQCENCGAFV